MKPFLGTLLGLCAGVALWIALGSAAFVLVWASDRTTSTLVGIVWAGFGLALAISYVRWVKRRAGADTASVSAHALRSRRGKIGS